MEKIVILGAKGMLGHMLSEFLRIDSSFEIIKIARNPSTSIDYALDILDEGLLRDYLEDCKPKYVINCVGLLVDKCIKDPHLAFKTNTVLPHFLDKLSAMFNFQLIHISTDCVFSGVNGPYSEYSFKNETNYYGLSKSAGEIINSKNLTIRTSIIGPELNIEGTGLFNWIVNENETDVFGYSEVFWSGVTTLELSKFITYLIKNNLDLQGLVHFTNNNFITKYDLLKLINKQFCLNKNVISYDLKTSNKQLLNYHLDYEVLSYEQMLDELYVWIIDNYDLYAEVYPKIYRIEE